MTELEELKRKIAKGVKRHFETEEGKAHREKLRAVMKKRWQRLKAEDEKHGKK
jgi:hypothetical protein